MTYSERELIEREIARQYQKGVHYMRLAVITMWVAIVVSILGTAIGVLVARGGCQ